jgi:two-component SAPR family response regulator
MEKWQQAAELLSEGYYERVGQILQAQQEAAQRSGQLATAVFLAAASQLCLTCLQFRAERKLHQLGLDEASRREQELRQQIQVVLTLLADQSPTDTQADLEAAFNLPTTQSILGEPQESNSGIQPNLLQKIQRLLGFEEASTSEKHETSAEHQYLQAEQEPATPMETDRAIVSPADDQDETPSTSQNQGRDEPASTLTQAEKEILQAAIDALTGPGHRDAKSLPAIDPEAQVLESQKGKKAPIDEEVETEASQRSPEIELLQSVIKSMEEDAYKSEGSLLSPEDERLVIKAEKYLKRGLEEDDIPGVPPWQKFETRTIEGGRENERDISDKQSPEPAGPLVSPALAKDEPDVFPERWDPSKPSLVVYCLGPFRVYQNDRLVTSWSGLKGLSIFKYLIANEGKSIAKEVLMEVFWPDMDIEATRRNLHQAIYSLRQTLRQGLPEFQHILFRNDRYELNPEIEFWIDFVELEHHAKAGKRNEIDGNIGVAMAEYGIAEGLYQGDFLSEDLYETWPLSQRERLRTTYLETADRLSAYYQQREEFTATIAICQKILSHDNCYETAHRRLMESYLAYGQRHLAVRQYETCFNALAKELDLKPSKETVKIYNSIKLI